MYSFIPQQWIVQKIATYKMYVISKSCNARILIYFGDS